MTLLEQLKELAPLVTEGPWFAGCQNDALFIVAGRKPALNNDYPWHEAPRVALAKMFGPTEGDCLPGLDWTPGAIQSAILSLPIKDTPDAMP